MIPHTVTDRGHYEEITLTEWGDATHLAACEVQFGDTVGAYILEPYDRQEGWSQDDEHNFRSDVRALVAEWLEPPDYLIFDPARDNQQTEEIA